MAREALIIKSLRTANVNTVAVKAVPTRITRTECALDITESDFVNDPSLIIMLTVEQSRDGVTWRHLESARFVGGFPSRVGEPFDPRIGISSTSFNMTLLRATVRTNKDVDVGVLMEVA